MSSSVFDTRFFVEHSGLLSSLPPNILERLTALHVHLGISVPDDLGSGLDSLSPIIEHFMDAGGIFFVKWDGERSSNRYTTMVMHSKIEQFRFDDQTPQLAAARVLLHLAGPVFGFGE